MPIPTEHIQERLSVAYVSAVVAKAGFSLWPGPSTEYGTDGLIQRIRKLPNGQFHGTGDGVMIQIKATIRSEIKATEVIYDMKIDAYNTLANWEGDLPCILVLLCLPRNINDWLYLDEDKLLLKRCCYWTQICDPPSKNGSQHRIRIPRTKIFDADAVSYLMNTGRSNEKAPKPNGYITRQYNLEKYPA